MMAVSGQPGYGQSISLRLLTMTVCMVVIALWVGVVTTEPVGGFAGLLDYRAPEGGCGSGDFVEVPLGPRRVLGVVWGQGEGRFDEARLRPVIRVLDAPPMREELRLFLSRAAEAIRHILKNGLAPAMNEFNKGGL